MSNVRDGAMEAFRDVQQEHLRGNESITNEHHAALGDAKKAVWAMTSSLDNTLSALARSSRDGEHTEVETAERATLDHASDALKAVNAMESKITTAMKAGGKPEAIGGLRRTTGELRRIIGSTVKAVGMARALRHGVVKP
jgi:hypothetical protein